MTWQAKCRQLTAAELEQWYDAIDNAIAAKQVPPADTGLLTQRGAELWADKQIEVCH